MHHFAPKPIPSAPNRPKTILPKWAWLSTRFLTTGGAVALPPPPIILGKIPNTRANAFPAPETELNGL